MSWQGEHNRLNTCSPAAANVARLIAQVAGNALTLRLRSGDVFLCLRSSRGYKIPIANTYSKCPKINLAEIVELAHNSNERPPLPGPRAAKPLFGSRLTLSDRFVRRRSSARITSGRNGPCLTGGCP